MERTRQIAREQGFVETILGRRLYTRIIADSIELTVFGLIKDNNGLLLNH